MWDSAFVSGNEEVKTGLEEESSFYTSLVQKYKTLKRDITKYTVGLLKVRVKLPATYQGICRRASSAKLEGSMKIDPSAREGS